MKISKPTITNETNFKEQPVENKNNNLLKDVCIAAAAVGVAGVSAMFVHGYSKSLSKVLEKKGLEIKDGIAYVKETNEKYTGKIEHLKNKFGTKKEVLSYNQGQLEEKLNYNMFGRELDGYFYRDGVLRVSVRPYVKNGGKKMFPYYVYDKDGKIVSCNDCFGADIKSVFDYIRDVVKKI